MNLGSIIDTFINLPSNRQQFIVNWLSARYLAVILKKCNDSERSTIERNMSRGLKERVYDELRINNRELEKPNIVKIAFQTLNEAIHSDEYKKNMKDSSYKRKRQN